MNALSAVGSTAAIDHVGPLPVGIKAPSTVEEKALYTACKSFEAVFVRQIVGGWMKGARGDGAAQGGQAIYQDMADEQMTSSLVEGGTFGLAGAVYAQLVGSLGKVTATV